MMQTEVGEVSEPYVPHRGSSSTMPNKFNPISCLYIHAAASTVRQHSAALMEAMVADHERSTGPWEIGKHNIIVLMHTAITNSKIRVGCFAGSICIDLRRFGSDKVVDDRIASSSGEYGTQPGPDKRPYCLGSSNDGTGSKAWQTDSA